MTSLTLTTLTQQQYAINFEELKAAEQRQQQILAEIERAKQAERARERAAAPAATTQPRPARTRIAVRLSVCCVCVCVCVCVFLCSMKFPAIQEVCFCG